MKVRELIQELEGFDPDAEVRLAQQMSWPFEYSVSEVVEVHPGEGLEVMYVPESLGEEGWHVVDATEGEPTDGPFATEEEAEDALVEHIARDGLDQTIVYVGEGTQIGYLPSAARRALGWS